MNTNELRALLRIKYPRDQYAFFEELPDATGSQKQRTADAWAMSLWPSRGLYTAGFELKVSRADWLKELKDPAKAERIIRYCDFWWIVVGDRAIVQPGELPETWGLLAPANGRLKVIKEAPKLEAAELGRGFLASILRRAIENLNPEAELKKAEEAGYKKGQQAGTEWKQREVNQLQDVIAKFERQAGVKLDIYNLGSIVEAVKLVRESRIDRHKDALRRIREDAERVVKALAHLDV